jgi:hypothetical protein
MGNGDQLLKTMQTKDRRFRFALFGFFTVLAIMSFAGLVLTAITLNNVQLQQRQLALAVKELKENTSSELKEANEHLDCVVLFFAEPDRTNKKLSDLENCDVVVTESAAEPVPATDNLSPQSPAAPRQQAVQDTKQNNGSSNGDPSPANPQANPTIFESIGNLLKQLR